MQYVQEAPKGVESVSGAVMSGRVESHAVAEEPEQALAVKRITEEWEEAVPAKQIAKELFPTGERLSKLASSVRIPLTKAMQQIWSGKTAAAMQISEHFFENVYFNPGEMMQSGGHEQDCIPTWQATNQPQRLQKAICVTPELVDYTQYS